jgi:predicted DCC family thiol-disulfide oxidoreductase YuxK
MHVQVPILDGDCPVCTQVVDVLQTSVTSIKYQVQLQCSIGAVHQVMHT